MDQKGKGYNIFKNVPKAKFDGDFGKAYPVFNQSVLPGDTWHFSINSKYKK